MTTDQESLSLHASPAAWPEVLSPLRPSPRATRQLWADNEGRVRGVRSERCGWARDTMVKDGRPILVGLRRAGTEGVGDTPAAARAKSKKQ